MIIAPNFHPKPLYNQLNQKQMTTVKVTYSNDDTITTAINGSEDEIRQYFKIGKIFNIGSAGQDNLQKVKKLEII